MEDLRDIGVELDHLVPRDGLLFVVEFYLGGHPVAEVVLEQRVDDVRHELPGQLVHVELVVGQVLECDTPFAFLCKGQELRNGEALVIWDVDVHGLLRRDPLAHAGGQVLQVPDARVLVSRQVAPTFSGQEIIDLLGDW